VLEVVGVGYDGTQYGRGQLVLVSVDAVLEVHVSVGDVVADDFEGGPPILGVDVVHVEEILEARRLCRVAILEVLEVRVDT
jgi:hypothetical protein